MIITFNNTQYAIDTFITSIPIQSYSSADFYSICHYLNNIRFNVSNMSIKYAAVNKILLLSSLNGLIYNYNDSYKFDLGEFDISPFINVQTYNIHEYYDFASVMRVLLDLLTCYKPSIQVNMAITIFDIMYLHIDMLTDNTYEQVSKKQLLKLLKAKLFEFSKKPYLHLQDACKKYLNLFFDINLENYVNIDDLLCSHNGVIYYKNDNTTTTTTTTTNVPSVVPSVVKHSVSAIEKSLNITTSFGRVSRKPVRL